MVSPSPMRTPTKKRPPMEMEPGEGKAHEMKESPGEEVREGTESEEGEQYRKPSRKRSAKGAKRTKAPMDCEGCSGKSSGKCKACSAKPMKDNCGSYPMKKRNDALTAPEYLAACELGIQDRSRNYIRARLDTAERLDLKCGNGAISEGEKCHVGAAKKVDPKAAAKQQFKTLMTDPVAANKFNQAKASTKGIGNKIKAAGEIAARLGGGAAMGVGLLQTFEGSSKFNLGEVSRGYRNMTLGASALQMANASKASRMGNSELSKEFMKSAGRTAAIGVGQEAAIGAVAAYRRTGGYNNLRRRTRVAYQNAQMRRSGVRVMNRDSAYANGFSLDFDQLAV